METAKIVYSKARKEGRIMRICWETNGHFNEHILKTVVDLSLESGGIIKFDLKAWSPPVYKALTGIDIGNIFKMLNTLSLEHLNVPRFHCLQLVHFWFLDI